MSCHPGGHLHHGWGFVPQDLADRQLEDLNEIKQICRKRSAEDSTLKTIYCSYPAFFDLT